MVDGPYLTGNLITRAHIPATRIHFGDKIVLDVVTGEWTLDPSLEVSEASRQIYQALKAFWNR